MFHAGVLNHDQCLVSVQVRKHICRRHCTSAAFCMPSSMHTFEDARCNLGLCGALLRRPLDIDRLCGAYVLRPSPVAA